jgi:pimeloyl-ACP methyl ester carboxylesterase
VSRQRPGGYEALIALVIVFGLAAAVFALVIVFGLAAGAVLPAQQIMVALSSNSRLIVVPSGHAIHFEQPAAVVESIRRSLKQ